MVVCMAHSLRAFIEFKKKHKREVRALLFFTLSSVFLTFRYAFTAFGSNDYDLLPYARQFMDPDWIPRDWYLNLEIDYRCAFNFVAGILCKLLTFTDANTVGRIMIAVLYSVAFYRLARTLKLSSVLIVPLIFILAVEHRFFIANEWFLLKFEAKCFAYALIILSISFLIEKK